MFQEVLKKYSSFASYIEVRFRAFKGESRWADHDHPADQVSDDRSRQYWLA